jgi:hypothetical protein
LLIILPGIISIFELHPYQYIYYNKLIGGLPGAENKYELDYFGLSLKESSEFVNRIAPLGSKVIVRGPNHIAKNILRNDIKIISWLTPNSEADYSLNFRRFLWSGERFKETEIFSASRNGVTFSDVREVEP